MNNQKVVLGKVHNLLKSVGTVNLKELLVLGMSHKIQSNQLDRHEKVELNCKVANFCKDLDSLVREL